MFFEILIFAFIKIAIKSILYDSFLLKTIKILIMLIFIFKNHWICNMVIIVSNKYKNFDTDTFKNQAKLI